MKRHIPNFITLLNLTSGICATILTMWGQYYAAFLFLIAAAIFDFLDGFSARLLHAYSAIGKELDSLSDMVSFGLVPSLMWFNWYLHSGHHVTALAYAALLIAAFSALRLAKFNIDTKQATSFIGLPTPACAMIVAPLTAFASICRDRGIDCIATALLDSVWFIPSASLALALLLVCNIPMFSMKGRKKPVSDHPRETAFFICVVLILLTLVIFKGNLASDVTGKSIGFFRGVFPLTLSLSFTAYVLINLAALPSHKVSDPTSRN